MTLRQIVTASFKEFFCINREPVTSLEVVWRRIGLGCLGGSIAILTVFLVAFIGVAVVDFVRSIFNILMGF